MPQTIAFSLLTTLDCLSECRGTGEGEREDGNGEVEDCTGRGEGEGDDDSGLESNFCCVGIGLA